MTIMWMHQSIVLATAHSTHQKIRKQKEESDMGKRPSAPERLDDLSPQKRFVAALFGFSVGYFLWELIEYLFFPGPPGGPVNPV